MPNLHKGDLNRGDLVRTGLSRESLGKIIPGDEDPPVPPPDPINISSAYGLGYFSTREAGFWQAGTGAGAGKVYKMLDLSGGVFEGDRVDRRTISTADLATVATDGVLGFGHVQLAAGTANQFSPQIGFPQTLVLAFRFPVTLINSGVMDVFRGFIGPSNYRPFVKFEVSAGAWTWTTDGGGVNDTTNQSEGNNVVHSSTFPGSGWHVLAMQHATAAGEGPMLDLDGKKLILKPQGFTHSNPSVYATTYMYLMNDSTPASPANINTIDYGDMAWGSAVPCTHAQLREIAEAMMGVYGVTSLA